MTVIYLHDSQVNPPKGVRDGQDGISGSGWQVTKDGEKVVLPNTALVELQEGEYVRGFDSSGGGYGNPKERDPKLVLEDVLETWETIERAREIYGVVFSGSQEDETLAVDWNETERLRATA